MKEHPILFNSEMVREILGGRKTMTRRLVKKLPCNCNPWIPKEMCNTTPEGWQTSGHSGKWWCDCCSGEWITSPYGVPGDRLWVRHTWWQSFKNSYNEQAWDEFTKTIRWKNNSHAEVKDVGIWESQGLKEFDKPLWFKKPSIHMPRWASRITLEITNVRVERVQEISEQDAIAEGIGRQIAHGKDLGWRNYLWHGDFGSYGNGNKKTDAWKYQYSTYQQAANCFSSLWESINGPGSWERNDWVWIIEFKKI